MTPRPIVLVHGSNHGGWCWQRVAPLLGAAGHVVLTPTLTGLGDRADQLTPAVGLSTHIADVVDLLEQQDLSDVLLVGHSYSGAVISGVAERCAGRIARMVYLDAFVLRDGEALLDIEPPASRQAFLEIAREQGDGWRLPAQKDWLDRWGLTDPDDRRWVWEQLTDMPLLASTEPAALAADAARSLPRSFLRLSDPQNPGLLPSIERARDEGCEMLEIKTGHDAMVSAPAELAELLEQLAARA